MWYGGKILYCSSTKKRHPRIIFFNSDVIVVHGSVLF
uniref:Uncharacterized protein n=1 Tax=Arundo donax TaxID=35708 RepID=A0A0A9CNP2_ARUDO